MFWPQGVCGSTVDQALLFPHWPTDVHHEVHANPSKKKTTEAQGKAKANKLKKIEVEDEKKDAEGSQQSPNRRPKGTRKFFLTDNGCRRGIACTWSHDLKDDQRRCYVCGCPVHMAPQCNRPKTLGEGSPAKAKLQKAEDEVRKGGDKDAKGKDEVENGSEEGSIKGLLEQANKMLKSLTSFGTTTFSSSSESRDEVLNRLQEQINSLKLKTLRISQVTCSNSARRCNAKDITVAEIGVLSTWRVDLARLIRKFKLRLLSKGFRMMRFKPLTNKNGSGSLT